MGVALSPYMGLRTHPVIYTQSIFNIPGAQNAFLL